MSPYPLPPRNILCATKTMLLVNSRYRPYADTVHEVAGAETGLHTSIAVARLPAAASPHARPHPHFPITKRRPALHRVLKICLATLLVTACSRTENTMSQDLSTTAAEADVDNGGRGLAKLNPQPRQAYEVVLKLHNAPGPFAVVEGVAQYDVTNEQECGRIVPETGRAGRITSQEPVTLKRVADDEYHGTVYLDQMLDEDYYGRGVCHWKFSGTGAMLKATGADGETRFLTFIDREKLLAGGKLTLHYSDTVYPRSTIMNDFPDSGRVDPATFRPELQDKLFSISVGADEIKS